MTYLEIYLYLCGAVVTYSWSRQGGTASQSGSVFCAVIWPVIGSLGLAVGTFKLIKSKVCK